VLITLQVSKKSRLGLELRDKGYLTGPANAKKLEKGSHIR